MVDDGNIIEAHLRHIIESAMDAIITVNADQRIVLFNPAAQQMFRCSGDDAIGQPIDRFIPDRFRRTHHEAVSTFGATRITNRRMGALGSVTGLRANGEEFPAEASISQFDTATGKYFTVILRDITERRKAEVALKDSQERFNAFMDHSPTVAFMKDEEGRYVYVNKPLEQLIRARDLVEWQGKTDGDIWPPETARQLCENDQAALASNGPVQCMETVLGPKGEPQQWLTLKFPFRDPVGRRYLAGVAIDISDHKRLEERLRQTERLAELGTLASGMAHEIGTPMNIILGRAEYLMRRTQEEATRKGLETIVAQVERITRIMNQLLTFARRRPSEPRAIDLRGIIEDTLEVLQDRLARHHIKVEQVFEDDVVTVQADADHMSQVLLNLVINAVHAMPGGGVLGVGLKRVDRGVSVTVSDTGHGIDPQHLSKIFDPFFTTKEVGKGTGLGLTVVHGIVQEHGGAIDVESLPGRGTTFTLTLPASLS